MNSKEKETDICKASIKKKNISRLYKDKILFKNIKSRYDRSHLRKLKRIMIMYLNTSIIIYLKDSL